MKTLIIAVLALISLPAFPQGAIDFRNGTSSFPEPPDRSVRFPDGTGVIGTQYRAQLYFAADAPSIDTGLDAAAAVEEPPSSFRATTSPGRWSGGTRTLVGTPPGTSRMYVVRAWDGTFGSYGDAWRGGGLLGQSEAFQYTPPTDPQAPPSAFLMLNFVGFTLVDAPDPPDRRIFVFGNGQLLRESEYTFVGEVSIELQSGFTNGTIFYTLDGSAPSFESRLYDGPFTLRRSATIRALAYDANFTTTRESLPVRINIVPLYSLTTSTRGGGTISVNPVQQSYVSNSVVTFTALPAPGWSFLQWLGHAEGTNPEISLHMNSDTCVEAVFGTSLNVVTSGSGSVLIDPMATYYPYGSTVRLTALPAADHSFALWGNAASGTNNPLLFTVSNPDPTVSSFFAPLSAGLVTLTVVEHGKGQVIVTPRANRYSLGQVVTLTAIPDVGQSLLQWSGDASGQETPLAVTLDRNKTLTANFTRRVHLDWVSCGGEASANPFRLQFEAEPGQRYTIEASSDLVNWTPITATSNSYGTVQLTEPSGGEIRHRFFRATMSD